MASKPPPAARKAPDPPPKPTGRYHHGDLKPALRAAGHARLARGGTALLSLRKLAKDTGVSHAAVYRHYADRETLLADLATDGFEDMLRLNREVIAATRGGPVQQLKASGRCYVRFGIERPNLLQLMFGPEIQDWNSHAKLAAAGRQFAALLDDLVRDGQASGELRGGDPRELGLAAWSIVHGLTLLLAGQRIPGVPVDEAVAARAAHRCTELMIEGLLRPATPASPVSPPSRAAPRRLTTRGNTARRTATDG